MNSILNEPQGPFSHTRNLELDDFSDLKHHGQCFCDSFGLSFWPQDGCCSSKSMFAIRAARSGMVGQHQKKSVPFIK